MNSDTDMQDLSGTPKLEHSFARDASPEKQQDAV